MSEEQNQALKDRLRKRIEDINEICKERARVRAQIALSKRRIEHFNKISESLKGTRERKEKKDKEEIQ